MIPGLGAVSIFFAIGLLGFIGGNSLYGQILGVSAGTLADVFGTTVHFDGEVLVIVRNAESLLQTPLEFHPNFSYSAIPLLTGVIVATPGLYLANRFTFGVLVPLIVFVAQVFLLTGFSFIDTSTAQMHATAKSTYTALWSMGPIILAAWWFWANWLPVFTRDRT